MQFEPITVENAGDGAMDRFLERCIADLRAALGEDWHVYQGA